MKKEVQEWLTISFSDPIAKILMKNSNLTKTQMETLLIDILAEKIAEKKIIFEEKGRLRLSRSGVSRGAFNRSLRQARRNAIRSMYTIVLLGYLGILESPRLEPFLELANKLHTYTEAYKQIWKSPPVKSEHMRTIGTLQKELEDGLKRLIEPKSMSERA